jgi:L-ascorbate metabolism protein UlaG (beta-lactamase superfamily)
MIKWLKRLAVFLLMVVMLIAALVAIDHADYQTLTSRRTDGPAIKPDFAGVPVDQAGRFMNDEFPFLPKLTGILQWRLAGNDLGDEKLADTTRLEVRDPAEFLASDRDGILWLGHASMFIRIGGVSILTDPVFGEPRFLRRLMPVANPLEKIRDVDYVLLSHDHRDHMDEATLRSIAQKFPDAQFLAGIGSEELLTEWVGQGRVMTAGWFKHFAIGRGALSIYFLPVRHWSRRGLTDTNERLWGGYVIQHGDTEIYFGGDSGYGRHYREAGELFPEIDYFIIGIGAYEPRWFMEPNHNNPPDAVKAFQDSRARYLIPMHYGTFDLSDEPPNAPLRYLKEEAATAGVADRVRPLVVNESLEIGGSSFPDE